MDLEAINRLITELRSRHGELEGVEAKAAHTGTPADLFKPLSAFANRAGGGILLFGLDEDAGFKVVGVGNPRKASGGPQWPGRPDGAAPEAQLLCGGDRGRDPCGRRSPGGRF